MIFFWPEALVLAFALPAFLAVYLRLDRQRRAAAQAHPSWYARALQSDCERPYARRIPLGLFLIALLAISLALARPHARLAAFSIKGTVVLALDVSTSMKADDVRPSRLARAQLLAKQFVAEHADELRIGLVSFGADAAVELEPTTAREALFAAIDRLMARHGTAIGSGIIAALTMITPQAAIDWDDGASGGGIALPAAHGGSAAGQRSPLSPQSHTPAAIVLISDGQSASGPAPLAAARLAAELGVRIHTVGVGSIEGKIMRLDGWSLRAQLDADALKAIATSSRGEYFDAKQPLDWSRLVDSMSAAPAAETYTELTPLFAAAAALAALAGALVSLGRTRRIL
ncbi:MAG: VWA domain-containing protein [Burkholderiales bacterium]|nr:VWA domain-containing protein [Burkholderiales bacterium]